MIQEDREFVLSALEGESSAFAKLVRKSDIVKSVHDCLVLVQGGQGHRLPCNERENQGCSVRPHRQTTHVTPTLVPLPARQTRYRAGWTLWGERREALADYRGYLWQALDKVLNSNR